MSKAIYICRRSGSVSNQERALIARICERLQPDNLPSLPYEVGGRGGIAYGVSNATTDFIASGDSLLAGTLVHTAENWHTPGHSAPDGSYALFRANAQTLEVISDPVASRTIWYYLDDEQLVCATSQRALIVFLGDFVFNEAVVPWVLSTGMLGPGLSWDVRLKRLPGDATLTLDRQAWTADVQARPVEFTPVARTAAEHEAQLRAAIVDSLQVLGNLDPARWVLPLSGGYDSRGILGVYHHENGDFPLKTVTWGETGADQRPNTDGYVAKQLADWYDVPNTYYPTDAADESIETVMARFLRFGEGRIDHITAYMDGFEMWRRMYADGVRGIVRGDHGLGYRPYASELGVRYGMGCALCTDYANLQTVVADFGFPAQQLPEWMHRRPNETLPTWTDRLYHGYRLPMMIAALSDLKFPYVEQMTPLLSRQILTQIRTVPDELRAGKPLVKSIVNAVSPDIPHSTSDGALSTADLLRQPAIVAFFAEQLRSEAAQSTLPADFLVFVLGGMQTAQPTGGNGVSGGKQVLKSLLKAVKKRIPSSVKDSLKQSVAQPSVDGNVLALRAYIIVGMAAQLAEDARCGPADEM